MNENKKLLLASISGDLKAIEQAISAGANINIRNPKGLSALHLAIINNRINIVKKLLSYKDNINLNISDKFGYSVLHEATKRQSSESIKLLLDSGADTEIENNDNQTPLQLAKSYLKYNLTDNNSYNKIIKIFENYKNKLQKDM